MRRSPSAAAPEEPALGEAGAAAPPAAGRRNPWWIPPFLGRVPPIDDARLRLLGLVSLALFFESYDFSMLTAALKQIAQGLAHRRARDGRLSRTHPPRRAARVPADSRRRSPGTATALPGLHPRHQPLHLPHGLLPDGVAVRGAADGGAHLHGERHVVRCGDRHRGVPGRASRLGHRHDGRARRLRRRASARSCSPWWTFFPSAGARSTWWASCRCCCSRCSAGA